MKTNINQQPAVKIHHLTGHRNPWAKMDARYLIDWQTEEGAAMDAPERLPAGSHRGFNDMWPGGEVHAIVSAYKDATVLASVHLVIVECHGKRWRATFKAGHLSDVRLDQPASRKLSTRSKLIRSIEDAAWPRTRT
ncbi:hypothetical protein [Polaromonas sp.]|uniref:hypothetical protein n=1 Tax=Polaromonas sp. TaxID=1869339 RepID=UPI0035691510